MTKAWALSGWHLGNVTDKQTHQACGHPTQAKTGSLSLNDAETSQIGRRGHLGLSDQARTPGFLVKENGGDRGKANGCLSFVTFGSNSQIAAANNRVHGAAHKNLYPFTY